MKGSPRRLFWAVLLPFWIGALAFAWSRLDEGWIPHDEGTLAQPAERVLAGEVPHRDFDDPYTGGLDWVNAAAFRIFGMSLKSMRIALFLVFAGWVPVVFWIATRFVGPLTALSFAALCVIWSLPMYPAPMPSWYVLFLSTFGTAALLRSLEGRRAFWLAAAGLCGGLAVLVKITGLHFLIAGALFLLWREPALTDESPASRRGRLYPAAVSGLLVLLVAFLVRQVWPLGPRFGFASEIEHFVLPEACLAGLVAWRAWTGSRAPDGARFLAAIRLAAPFLGGFLAPVAAFVMTYAVAGATSALIEGVLILPGRRIGLLTTSSYPPPVWSAVFSLALALIATIPAPRGRRWRVVLLAAASLGLSAAIFASARDEDALQIVEVSVRHLLPVGAIFALWKLRKAAEQDVGARHADRTVAVLAAATMVSLVQFPFSAHIYFFYSAPLLVLAGLGLASAPSSSGLRPGMFVVAGFLIVSMLIVPLTATGRLDRNMKGRLRTERGGLRITVSDATEYDRVIALLQAHAKGGCVWAGPDAPEIAFLAGLRNPTRTIFDCFDKDFDDPAARSARLLETLDEQRINVIAIHGHPSFSGPPPRPFLLGLDSRFKKLEIVGRYGVAWRE